jgi:hypothetical protein
MKPNMMKKWSIALLVAAGAASLVGCEGMRVDEGASTATNNGNVAAAPNGSTLKTNLTGVVVDDFGMPVSGMTVSAYGRTATTGSDGHWMMNNVPVTGMTINSTPQNLEQTNLTTSGTIYVTYQKVGYATYHSRIDNAQAVITHYGTAGGNPNSLVVDNLVASDRVKIPALSNSLTGLLVDKGTLFTGELGNYGPAPAQVQVRLVPEILATNAQAGYAQYGGSSCQTECGFFGLPEYVTQTDANGKFTFSNVAKLNGGYVLRVDNYGYRASERPNDYAGFSYNWDANGSTTIYGGLFPDLSVTQGEWEITDDKLGIGFDAHGSNSIDKLINLGPLFVQNYLVATNNTVEGISVGDKTYNPNDDQGFTSDDGHNTLDGIAAMASQADGGVIIDSSIVVNLGTTTPLKFIFSGDMRTLADLSEYPNGVIVFDGAGNRISIDTAKTNVTGRVLQIYTTAALSTGKTYFVRLHRDVFVDMDAKRLLTEEELSALNGAIEFDPSGSDEAISMTDDKLYAEYFISYITPDVVTTPLTLAQSHITDATRQQISATGSALSVLDSTWKLSDSLVGDDNNEDDRLDILYNAVRDRYDGIYDDDAKVTVRTDTASVTFDVVKNKMYRLRVYNPSVTTTTIAAGNITVVSPTGTAADTDNMIGTTAEVSVDNDGNAYAEISFMAVNTGTAEVDLKDVGIGYKIAVVKANDFGDFAAYDDAMTIELKDDLAPLVALQHSDRSGQDNTNYNNDVAPHDSIGMLVEFGELTTDEAGEPINGDTKIYYPKLNLTASLYDECHRRAKSENTDENFDDAQEPQNQSQLDAYYATTPLLASAKTYTTGGTTYGPGTCATLSSIGTTCATSRQDNIYNATDYQCWYGSQTTTSNTCTYYIGDPGLVVDYYQTSSNLGSLAAGAYAINAAPLNGTVTTVADATVTGYTSATLPAGVSITFGGVADKTTYYYGPAGCIATNVGGADVARNIVIDMTESVAAIADNDNTTALQSRYETALNIAAGATLADDANGLLHLETPAQHSARAKVYFADTAGSTVSSRTNHLIATLGDWRTITETGRFITKDQDVVSSLYNDLAETYVIDSESDGADAKSVLKLIGEKDADNTDLSIAAGHASGVLLVDATPAMATSFKVTDSTLTLEFDQPILDDANYPVNRFIDIHGDDYVYRVDVDDETMIRGMAGGSFTTTLDQLTTANSTDTGSTAIDIDGAATGTFDNNRLYAGARITITDTDAALINQAAATPGGAASGYDVGATSIAIDGLNINGTVAGGSILRVAASGAGSTEQRYTVVADVTVAGGAGTFVITPPLRTAILNNVAIDLIKSSTHVTTADEAAASATSGVTLIPIYPALPSHYNDNSEVVWNNVIQDSGTTAYVDAFGLSTGEFVSGAAATTVVGTIAVTGSTMTITASDTAPAAQIFNSYRTAAARTGNAGEQFTVALGEKVDMGGFFSDLSHTDAMSVLGKNEVNASGIALSPAVLPDIRLDYQDVQDTNYNSWAKVETYDQYDNSGSPQLVGEDQLAPKLQQDGTAFNSTNTFLYDVTASAGFALVAAHGSGTVTDADSIYTYDATAGVAPGAGAEDDYPLFHFWGYNTTTSSTTANTARAVLKLSGVTTIDAQYAQAYIYAPNNTAYDIDETQSEANTLEIIIPSAIVDDSASAAQGERGMVDQENDATISATGVTAPALLVGIPAYGGATWDSTTDKLVVEDVLLDGVPFTLHFSIPQYVTTDLTTNLVENGNNRPTLTVYRKVSFTGLDLLDDPSSNAATAMNLRAGNAVTSTYDVHGSANAELDFNFREDFLATGVTSSIGYTIGTDHDSAADDDRVTFTSSSAVRDTTTASLVTLDFDFNTEGSTKYIGHGSTFTTNVTDLDGNPGSFTITLNLGHGDLNIDPDNSNTVNAATDGAVDVDNDNTAEVVDPILNIISGSSVE